MQNLRRKKVISTLLLAYSLSFCVAFSPLALAVNLTENPSCGVELQNWPSVESPFLVEGRRVAIQLSQVYFSALEEPFFLSLHIDPKKDLSQYAMIAYIDSERPEIEDKIKWHLGWGKNRLRDSAENLAKWIVVGTIQQREDGGYLFAIEHLTEKARLRKIDPQEDGSPVVIRFPTQTSNSVVMFPENQ
ncbi:MAG: hypothetical protein AAF202_00355 [Pseudomonadota bacterium]